MEPEQWLVFLLFMLPGALIWFGFYRSWVRSRTHRYPHLAFPWASLVLVAYALSEELKLWNGLALLAMVGLLLIGMSAALFSWPSWAVPRWYREYEASESSESGWES